MIDSRASAALRDLAETLLKTRLGDALPSRSELANVMGVGIGTLARALDTLTVAGAVVLRGVQGAGTTVEQIDYAALWRFAGRSILRGQLPMNLSVQMEAVEVAIGQALAACDLDAALVYREGAARRIRATEAGQADFAVVSDRSLHAVSTELEAGYAFGASSYYGSSSLYLLRRTGADPIRRVGVDEHSPDHVDMVTREFPDAEVVVASFRLIPAMIIEGSLDATLWFGGTALQVEHVNLLRTEVVRAPASEVLGAEALVVAPGGGAVQNLFAQLDDKLLRSTFLAVVEAGPVISAGAAAGVPAAGAPVATRTSVESGVSS